MKNIPQTNSHTFEDSYFQKNYIHISDFSEQGSVYAYNWFTAIFHAIDPYSHILSGHNKTALEFGSAAGIASKLLTDIGYLVTATDISSYAVLKAKKLYPDIHFSRHDIQKRFPTKKRFDLIIALDVIEHLPNPTKAIENMCMLLKPNGIVVCSTPNDYAHEWKVPTHISVKKPEVWKKIFQKAGFKNTKIHQRTFLPFFYRYHWRLGISVPFGINFHYPLVCAPVFIFARK